MLARLRIRDFRNFAELDYRPVERVNFLYGDNGQGKTSLLEAIHLISHGESFRASNRKHWIRNDSPTQTSWIDADINQGQLKFQTQIKLSEKESTVLLNGKRTHFAALGENFSTVLFSPETLSIAKAGPEERRNFVDELLSSFSDANRSAVRQFKKCLQTRNAMLKQIQESEQPTKAQYEVLESLTKIFLLAGTHLTVQRIDALKKLLPHFLQVHAEILGKKTGETAQFEYRISDQQALAWSEEQIFDALSKRQSELARAEVQSGHSLVGPSKHDLVFLFAGNDSRFFGSQGQQRALILALKIAQISLYFAIHNRYPILLLDDVLSELDQERRNHLMKMLEQINTQVFMTSTDLNWSHQLGLKQNAINKLNSGKIISAQLDSGQTLHAEL